MPDNTQYLWYGAAGLTAVGVLGAYIASKFDAAPAAAAPAPTPAPAPAATPAPAPTGPPAIGARRKSRRRKSKRRQSKRR